MRIKMERFKEVGLKKMTENVAFADLGFRSSSGRTSFQWGGTVFALFLLLLNRTGRRSHLQTNLLVLYLFTSFPTVLFKILRGQVGCWVAFLAVGANLFYPQTCPVARFILFVIAPDWLADELRDGIAAGIFCLIMGVLLVIIEIRETRGFRDFECSFYCFGYIIGIFFLFFFTISYLCLGT
ncbi:cold-regulated 413 plasma membrane protein 1-like isoform X1 [Pistacia vera]|uniref:cold-regulated 413 plasma membrane protein 1-like isoform X1 n=1 Tax=Pistacia vera TaxID=55513 RepID=UPI001263AD6F|nr:cold-regulated 413 plasma membrane protein 1-like isoform X1 [Pistacia vera]